MTMIDKHVPNFFGDHKELKDLMAHEQKYTFGIDEVDQLADPGYLEIESGLVRRPDGSWFMAIHTDFGKKVNGEMFDWWFQNCDDNEKYRWSHPRHNMECTWDPTYYASMPHERKRCYHIDHIQYIRKELDGVEISLQIEYLRPSKYFDVKQLQEKKVSAVVVGRIYNNDPNLGLVGFGYIVHLVREISNKGESECRTRIWLGDMVYPETLDNFLYARCMNYIGSSPLYKSWKFSQSVAYAIYTSFSEEMNALTSFLPHYYSSTKSRIKDELRRLKSVPRQADY